MADQQMAQDIILCDLCQASPVKTHCHRCNANLCNNCTPKHIMNDTTIAHEIVAFEMKITEPAYPFCRAHSKQKCEMYCRQCDMPACVKCLASHNKHDLTQIFSVLDSQREFIQRDTKQLETVIYPKYVDAVYAAKEEIAKLPRNTEKLMNDISAQGEDWHEVVDKIVKGLKEEVKKMETADLLILKKHLTETENIVPVIQQIIQDNKDLLENDDSNETINYKSQMARIQTSPPKVNISLPTFLPLPIQEDDVLKMFGTLNASFTLLREMLNQPMVIDNIETSYKYLWNVACVNPDEIWVSGNDSSIKRFDMKGSLQQSVPTTPGFYPNGITVSRRGELIYTDYDKRCVFIIRNGKQEQKITLGDWKPKRIFSTASDDLLVGMYKDENTPSQVVRYTGSTERQIIRYDHEGRQLFSTGRLLFIDENQNGDLCFSDNKAKAVVVINSAGKLLFKYMGNPSSERSFDPHGIVTDSKSQILIADKENHCIHILDQKGSLIQCFDNLQIHHPYCFSLDKNNILFVGEYSGATVKRIRYLE